MKGQKEGEWVEVALSKRRVHASDNTDIIGNISFIYVFKLILTSIKLPVHIFLKKFSTLFLKLYFLLKAPIKLTT